MNLPKLAKTPHPAESAPRRALVGAAVLGLLVYSLAFQGSRGIWEPDEGRYTDIACQMLRSGDYLVPAFNDEVPHFAKPPLTYWAIAASLALFGYHEWSARLPNTVAFVVTVLVVFLLARRLQLPRPWVAPLSYATSLLPYLAANVITTDTLLTLFESLGVLAFLHSWQGRDRAARRGPLFAMWAAFGLAFLTKGPPALLPLVAIAAWVALTSGWRAVARLFCPGGVAVFALVGLGWYLLVALANPGLMSYFLRNEVVARLASGAHHRNPQWYGAVIVYGPTLLIGTLPWTWVLLRRLPTLRRTLGSRQWWKATSVDNPPKVFLALWVLLPLTVFAVSSSRLPLYVLPLFVPLSLTVGMLVGERPLGRRWALLAALAAVLLLGLRLAASRYETDRDARALARALLAAGANHPREVLFVNAQPIWGLALYFPGSEIEEVAVGPGGRHDPTSEPLVTELREHHGAFHLLFEPRWRSAVEAEISRHHRTVRELGRVQRWELLVVE